MLYIRPVMEEVEENDSTKLIEAMTYVRDVRLSSDRIDAIFEPLKQTIVLLKKFNIHMPEETIERANDGNPIEKAKLAKTIAKAFPTNAPKG